MESSRARIAGPAIAVGAVSIGLVLIGACGIGKQDTYVPPPPLKAGQHAEPAARAGSTSSTTPKVLIPPSPSWKMAPVEQRQATPFAGFVSSTTPEPTPGDAPAAAPGDETRPAPTTRPAVSDPPATTPSEAASPQRRTTQDSDE